MSLIAGLASAAATAPTMAQNAPAPLWETIIGNSSLNRAAAGVAVDPAGAIFIGGITVGDLAGPSAGGDDGFVARFDEGGNNVWVAQFGTSANDRVNAIAIDGAGGVFMAGETFGELGGTHMGGADGFVARFDGQGNQLWIKQFGTSSADIVQAAASDGAGGVFISGRTAGELAGPSMGSNDPFLARYDSEGNELWMVQFGSTGTDQAFGLAPDGSGGVFIAGSTSASIGGQPHLGGSDGYVGRFDANGTQLWIRQIGTSAQDFAVGITSDGAGGAFVTGRTFGDYGGTGAGGADVFITRYDGDGNELWVRQFGTGAADFGTAAAGDGEGGVFAIGYTSGALFGPHLGSQDAFVARLDADGDLIWADQFGTASNDPAQGAAADGHGGVYIVGHTQGDLGGSNPGFWSVYLVRYPGSDACYANCDGSTGEPLLTVDDFTCFINEFAAAQTLPHEEQIEHYANCDGSTTAPVLTVDDFTCFINAFAQGCP